MWSARANILTLTGLLGLSVLLAALVPKLSLDLTRYHSAFASIMFFIRHRLIWFGGDESIPVV